MKAKISYQLFLGNEGNHFVLAGIIQNANIGSTKVLDPLLIGIQLSSSTSLYIIFHNLAQEWDLRVPSHGEAVLDQKISEPVTRYCRSIILTIVF